MDYDKMQAIIDEKKQQLAESNIEQETVVPQEIVVQETTNVPQIEVTDNAFVTEMTNNSVAIQMAKEGYNDIKNQKNIAKGIKTVAIENTKADIQTAQIKVEEKRKTIELNDKKSRTTFIVLNKRKNSLQEKVGTN